MLAVNRYPKDYVESCRKLLRDHLKAYEALLAAAHASAAGDQTALAKAAGAFELRLARGLVLMLEQCFVHRLRGAEGKDGNPLNELRMLAHCILHEGGVLRADKAIRYDPAQAVLGCALGEEIRASPAQLGRLVSACCKEIEAKYT